MVCGSGIRLAALAPLVVALLPNILDASPQSPDGAAALRSIQVLFKLDPRLTRSDQMGDRWLSRKTYTGTVGQDTVEVKAFGLDAQRRPIAINPEWIPSDPEMVMVSPDRGDAVKIVVKRAGESKVQLTAQGVSKELPIKAEYRSNALRVEITQPETSEPAKTEVAAAASNAEEPSAFKTAGTAEAEKEATTLEGQQETSYALGLNLGRKLKQQGVDLDAELLARGLKDALGGGNALLTEAELTAALGKFENELRARQVKARQQSADKNKEQGQAFLAENKSKEGVVALESGLQYKVLKTGDGPKPTLEDTVVCHYRGTLIDGTEFDSSFKRNKPATLPLKRLVKGWTEALQLMPVGSKWQLFVPANLAYGARGVGRTIGPNATLVFEVELLSIQEKLKAARKHDPAPPKHAPDAPPQP